MRISIITKISQETITQGIFRSSFINTFSKLFAYLKSVSIAVIIGFGFETDAFFMAMGIVSIFIIFADTFDSIGVPALVKARQESYRHFHRLAASLLTFTLLIAFFTLIISIVFMPTFIKIAIGFEQEEIKVLKSMYIFLLPYVFLAFFFHHFGAINRSLRRYSVYFLGLFVFSFTNFVFVTIGLLIYRDAKVVPISFSLAQAISVLYMILVTREFLKFDFFLDERLKSLLKQFFYLIFVYGVLHIFVILDRAFASLLPEKNITALSYGLSIATIPKSIVKLEHILITPLSEINADIKIVKSYLARTFGIALAISCVFFLISPLLVNIFYNYGAFSHLDYILTSKAAQYYSLSIPFMFVWPLLYRVFQIRNEFKYIIIIAVTSCILNGWLNYLFVIKLSMGLIGLCLGTLGAYICLVILSYLALIKRG